MTRISPADTSPIRAAYLIAAFFPAARGATFSAFRLACALRERNVEICWLVNGHKGAWKQGGEHEGFPVRAFGYTASNRARKWQGFFRLIRWIWKRRSTLRILHIHGGGPMNILAVGVTRLLIPRVRVVFKMTLDGWDTPDAIRNGRNGRLLFRCINSASAIVAMTSGQREKVVASAFGGESPVIPNGVDTTKYSPNRAARTEIRRRLGIPENAPVIAYVGTVGHRKGTDILLEAWQMMNEAGVESFLLMIGDFVQDRDQEAYIHSALRDAGIDPAILKHPRVRRTGLVDDAERYLQASDIFVFPSRQEGFGTVQIEAMACGLPCVVNDLPGVSADIYPDESVGFRVSKNEPAEYAAICWRLIDDPELRARVGAAARERAVSHFSIDKVADAYRALYRRLLDRCES